MTDTQTGHKKELTDASTKLAKAITSGDAEALQAAASAHATALNSQATAMAASIAAPVYTQLGDIKTQIADLAHIVTNARQADLNWRTEERLTRDAQSTRLYEELDRLVAAAEDNGARLGKIESRLETDEARLDSKRVRIELLEEQVAALKVWVEGLPTPDESRRLIALLEQLAAERNGDAQR